MSLRFDPDKHEYWLEDRRLPSVSEIIAPIVDYSMVPEDRLTFARDRGTAVHKACELDDRGTLDDASVDDEHVRPFLEAYRRFRIEYEFEPVSIEEPRFCLMHGFAGTPDRFGSILLPDAKTGRTRRVNAVLDLKTVAQMGPVTGVQLAGYELLLDRYGMRGEARIGLQLRKDGTYRVRSYGNEVPTFLSLRNLWNWRQKHA